MALTLIFNDSWLYVMLWHCLHFVFKVHFSNFRKNNLEGLCWGDQVTGPSFPWDVQGASKDHESAETTRTAKIQDPDDLYVDMV